ncbi:ubiquinone biosynthesis UbiH/UbiF/VisC/COQ6 family hydroxylase [Novosphingobium sp. PhB55]|nr:ubiquinone biosynthesis UbiH/UbiF/VisC/COQ6 family hydroxylase [Novosphingobium sp. PhB55]
MMTHDVVVVGAGPAGLAFAAALAGSGLRIAVIERQPASVLADPPMDGREIALTHRSIRALQELGAWPLIDAEAIAPLREARVLNGGSPFALSFGSGDAERLGQLVPNHLIRRALFRVVADLPEVEVLAGRSVASIDGAIGNGAQGVSVSLKDGNRLEARLLVGADSRFSFVREQLGIGAEVNRLGRSMLVCRVTHEGEHQGIATEWFDHGQTMAMLPLNGRRSSAVLTLASAEIAQLAALDAEALGAELTRRYESRLGRMQAIGSPHVYPLATTYAHHFAARRAALIGDAAVGMHPVTAHGFNLGLASACSLGKLVAQAALQGDDIGGGMLLRRYEAAHRLATRPIYTATNLIVGLYTAEHPAARAARHAGLRAAARLPLVSRSVSRLLMQR